EISLDTFTDNKLEDLINQEIDHLVGQDVYIVSESEELLIAAIESNVYEADDFSCAFEISKLTSSNHIKITVDAKLSYISIAHFLYDSIYYLYIQKGAAIWKELCENKRSTYLRMVFPHMLNQLS